MEDYKNYLIYIPFIETHFVKIDQNYQQKN